MSAITRRQPGLVFFIATMIFLVLTPRGSSSLADGSPGTKGPEVLTVGAGPYLGPLPEELAKLAEQTASTETAPAPAKEPAAATITIGGNTLTAEELAKLAAAPAVVDTTSAPLMPKLGPMTVSKDGTQVLTLQEREKHARELATPPAPQAASPIQPAPPSVPKSSR